MPELLDKLPPRERRLIEWAKRKRELKGTFGVLVEGEKLVAEGLASNLKFDTVWITPETARANNLLIERLRNAGCWVSEVPERVMAKISEMETPPGIAAAAFQPLSRLSSPHEKWRFIVAIFGAQDPGNAGGVIRTAEYFGADEVWLGAGSVDPYSPKVIRGSMGACLRLPVFRGDIAARIGLFKTGGAIVWASVAHGNGEPVIADAPKRILMIGSESQGLSEAEISIADRLVRIPAKGRGESLNLGVAAGILIYSAMTSSDKIVNSAKLKDNT